MQNRNPFFAWMRAAWHRLRPPKLTTQESSAAAREHQTQGSRGNTPVEAVGGISTGLQWQCRFDANGVVLELPAEPLPDALYHGFTETDDPNRQNVRTILEGCEGSVWRITPNQVLRHLAFRASLIDPDELPEAVRVFIRGMSPGGPDDRCMSYHNPPGGSGRILKSIPSGGQYPVAIAELEQWTIELARFRIQHDFRQHESLVADRGELCVYLANPPGDAETTYCFHLRDVRTAQLAELSLLTAESFGRWHQREQQEQQERRQRPLRTRAQIAAENGTLDGYVTNDMIAEGTITRGRPGDFVSSGTDPLPDPELSNIESFSSNQGFQPRPRRMRIRGRQ